MASLTGVIKLAVLTTQDTHIHDKTREAANGVLWI